MHISIKAIQGQPSTHLSGAWFDLADPLQDTECHYILYYIHRCRALKVLDFPVLVDNAPQRKITYDFQMNSGEPRFCFSNYVVFSASHLVLSFCTCVGEILDQSSCQFSSSYQISIRSPDPGWQRSQSGRRGATCGSALRRSEHVGEGWARGHWTDLLVFC